MTNAKIGALVLGELEPLITKAAPLQQPARSRSEAESHTLWSSAGRPAERYKRMIQIWAGP